MPHYLLHSKTAILNMFHVENLNITIPLLAVSSTMSVINIMYVISFLGGLMLLDTITGILASFRRYENKHNKEFHSVKDYIKNFPKIIQSKKLKLLGVKILLYGTTITLAYVIEHIFFIKSFNIGISEAKFTLAFIVSLYWILVESYSIIFENIRDMGFSIKEKNKQIIKDVKEIKSDIKNLKDE